MTVSTVFHVEPALRPSAASVTPSLAPPSKVDEQDSALLNAPLERSPALTRLLSERGARSTMRRAAVGLIAAMPFAFTVSLAVHSEAADVALAMLTLPVSIGLLGAVALAASTIGVSLLSAPLGPQEAADVGADGVLRMGMLLLGLTPITVLWVASYGELSALVIPTLAWAIAGIAGATTILRRLLDAVHPSETITAGTVAVLALLGLFLVVGGAKLWWSFLTAFEGASLLGGGAL